MLDFWFGRPADPAYALPRAVWFRACAAFDRAVLDRCAALHADAATGRLDGWASSPLGSLALAILLDQAPRNLFRRSPRAYATDTQALALARTTVAAGFDRELTAVQRWFVYLPFEHSERLEDQERALALFASNADDPQRENTLRFARRHHEIVARFGRFPHRNVVLGRPSTPEEEEFLKQPGSAF